MSAPDYLELYANRTSARNRSLTVLPSARLVSANPALALSTIKASDDPTQEDAVSALASLLQPILPYLTYPALLYLASESSGLSSLLFPGTAADQAAHLSTLIDFQRDWVGSAACETRFQDDFLVDVFGPGGGAAWGAMRADCAFKLVSPAGSVELLKGEQNEGTPCESYEKFKKALHKTTGGLLAKGGRACTGGSHVLTCNPFSLTVDFSNVVLGGGEAYNFGCTFTCMTDAVRVGCVLGILTGQIKEHWYEGCEYCARGTYRVSGLKYKVYSGL